MCKLQEREARELCRLAGWEATSTRDEKEGVTARPRVARSDGRSTTLEYSILKIEYYTYFKKNGMPEMLYRFVAVPKETTKFFQRELCISSTLLFEPHSKIVNKLLILVSSIVTSLN